MIRQCLGRDREMIRAMLLKEGLSPSEMAFDASGHETWVMEEDGGVAGFFTLREEHGLPYVVHFCGQPGTGWALARELKWVLGGRRALVNVPVGKGKLLAAARRVLGAEAYGVKDGHVFLVMEGSHG